MIARWELNVTFVLTGVMVSWCIMTADRAGAEVIRPEAKQADSGEKAADAIAVARRRVDRTKDKWRHEFERFEREWEAANALRQAEQEKSHVLGDLSKKDPKAAEKLRLVFEDYRSKCEEARIERSVTRLKLTAESTLARTTPEDLAKADAKLEATRKTLPAGEGAAYEALRNYHERVISLATLKDRLGEEGQAKTNEMALARREWFALKDPLKAKLEKVVEAWEEELHRLREGAESAKFAEAGHEDLEWPEEKRWPAARRRFEEFMARELDLAAAVKP